MTLLKARELREEQDRVYEVFTHHHWGEGMMEGRMVVDVKTRVWWYVVYYAASSS